VSLAEWFDTLVTPSVSERPLALLDEERVTYGQIRERAWAIGSGLQRLGAAGERVVTMLPNDPALLAIQLGTVHAGGIAVPVIAEGTPDEMRHFVEDSDAGILIATPERWAAVAPLLRKPPRVVVLSEPTGARAPDGGLELTELAQVEADGAQLGLDPVHVRDTDPMALMYTSGSTSRPKGVVIDAASFIKDAEIQPELFGLRDGENVLGVVQLYHIAGWHQALAIALGCRGGLVMQRRFSASRFWEDVDRSQAVAGLLMPAMVSILLARRERDDDADHPFRAVLAHWVDDAFEERFGAEMVPVWGQTELGGLAASGRIGDSDRPRGCVGRAVPGTAVEVRDAAGAVLSTCQSGEICVKSPWIMKGYWRDPDLTTSVVEDGWVRTGDIGYLDDEGRLFFAGRLKAMIKRAGENISALEVEEAIAAHPDVSECVCFSVPDPVRTEEVKAVLVPREGAQLDLPGLVDFSRERLAEFKVPRYWEVREDLPRTRSLKVAVGVLRNEHDAQPGWDRSAGAGSAVR
jgi:crotonobetaine/carnitine-CoA ligase